VVFEPQEEFAKGIPVEFFRQLRAERGQTTSCVVSTLPLGNEIGSLFHYLFRCEIEDPTLPPGPPGESALRDLLVGKTCDVRFTLPVAWAPPGG